MPHTLSLGLAGAAFLGAGIYNAVGTTSTRNSFVRWGYPAWWCYLTGALEVLAALLLAVPVARQAGLILGTAIIGAAVVTVLRHREFSHLAPLGALAALLALAGVTS